MPSPRYIWATALVLLLGLSSAPSAESMWDKFKDPEDGAFDMSDYLAGRSGFLPIPILITEPALGYGGGLVAVYFYPTKFDSSKINTWADINAGEYKRLEPPTVSGAMGYGTANGSWGTGIFHRQVWKGDVARYLGAVMYNHTNLKFYGFREDGILRSNPIEYSLDGTFILQEVQKRLWNSDFFAGVRYSIFLSNNSELRWNPPVDWIDEIKRDIDTKNAGLAFFAVYEKLDNTMTPNEGILARARWTNYNEIWGGDNNYNKLDLDGFGFIDPHPRVVTGLRLDGQFIDGDAPFYGLPFVHLRGVPAMKYQGEIVLTTELDIRWRFYKRWSAVFFGGVGWPGDSMDALKDARGVGAGGFGFRYFLARLYGMQGGLDFAWSEEDFAWYITMGSYWH